MNAARRRPSAALIVHRTIRGEKKAALWRIAARRGFIRSCDFGVDLWCDREHIVQCGIARRPTTLPYVF